MLTIKPRIVRQWTWSFSTISQWSMDEMKNKYIIKCRHATRRSNQQHRMKRFNKKKNIMCPIRNRSLSPLFADFNYLNLRVSCLISFFIWFSVFSLSSIHNEQHNSREEKCWTFFLRNWNCLAIRSPSQYLPKKMY